MHIQDIRGESHRISAANKVTNKDSEDTLHVTRGLYKQDTIMNYSVCETHSATGGDAAAKCDAVTYVALALKGSVSDYKGIVPLVLCVWARDRYKIMPDDL